MTTQKLDMQAERTEEVGITYLRQVPKKPNRVRRRYELKTLASKFGLNVFDDTIARVGSSVIFYHHKSGASVKATSQEYIKLDCIEIMGTPAARLNARKDIERLAEEAGFSVIELNKEAYKPVY